MPQAKVLSEQEFKRALAVVAKRRHHARDRLALLLTHWAGMRVCEVAALTIDKVIGPAGEVLDEFRLDTEQTKGTRGRVVLVNQRLRREIAAYLKTNPPLLGTDPLLLSQKANRRARGFSANTLCQLINVIYREAGIQGATSHSGRLNLCPMIILQFIGFICLGFLFKQFNDGIMGFNIRIADIDHPG